MSKLKEASEFILAGSCLPISSVPLQNVCIAIEGDKILELLPLSDFLSLPENIRPESKIRHFENALVCPGLMNLHTHLDYTALKHFDNYSNFFKWIRSLIASSWQWSGDQWFESALLGARELISCGNSFIADASYSGAAARAVARSGLRGIVGLELFGIDENESERVFAEWLSKYDEFLATADPELKEAIESKRLRITIAPHTPYSVCPSLISRALAWSKEQKLPLLIHISESEAECRWLNNDDSDLNEFLKEAFRLKELSGLSWRGHGLSPVEHMQKYGLLSANVLAAHLVQINKKDIEILKANDVAGVHCPRSNSRLRNGVSPFADLCEAGLRMGLGTDSAASGDDLDVRAEAAFAWSLHRAINKDFALEAEKALYYLTLGAAKALNLDDCLGSIEAGKKADLSIFDLSHLPEIARQKPYESLIYGGAKPDSLLVDGKWLLKSGKLSLNANQVLSV